MTIVVGAGIAGLLAANMLSCREPNVVVVESRPALPHGHSAVLRFRSSVVGDTLGIPFRKVQVIKAAHPWDGPISDALAYSRKTTGVSRSDRSLPPAPERAERWIAPPDLIERMAANLDVRYGAAWDFAPGREKVISTIPMPALAKALGYDGFRTSAFVHRPGFNVLASVDACDAYVSLYVPNPGVPYSRVSLTGNQLIVECQGQPTDPDVRPLNATEGINLLWSSEDTAADAAELLGISRDRLHDVRSRPQSYAKILPIDEGERRQFIYWASTLQGRAFSLGRFATWRPHLLADDLVKDVRLIESWIDSASPGYDMERHDRSKA